ncbi:MAG: UDP-N-acetylglucosamine 2-epimerase [Methanoregula sp.]
MKRKILYISGTRADYGFMEPVLKKIQTHSDLEIEIIITGMHLMQDFGFTGEEITQNSFRVHEIEAVFDNTPESVLKFMASFFQKTPHIIRQIKPDIILVAGDRAEMLAGAIIASYMSIPLAHVSGGDVTSTIDEHIRHSITKLAQIHFPYTPKSAERIFKMGEDRWRIHMVGSPGVYHMLHQELATKNELAKKYNLDLSRPYILMIQHPVTLESDAASEQIRKTLSAIADLDIQTILVYPNADVGGLQMINVIEEYAANPNIRTFKSIPSKDFFSLMKYAGAMVGNSSSGIVEAPSYHLPVINIGSRQAGRERGKNVLDVGCDSQKILQAIKKALFDEKFRSLIQKSKNPYDNGDAALKIANVLASVVIDKRLLQKQLRY